MLKQLPEDEFGPPIGIREYSLFDNPSMPQKVHVFVVCQRTTCLSLYVLSFINNMLWFCYSFQVKASWLDVNLCREGSQGCQISNDTSQTGVIKFPKLSSEEMVIKAIRLF